jgi:hypothetical protein
MSRADRIREKYPLFYAYGDTHKFLDAAEAVAATPEERIQSIWPFLVGRVRFFQGTLKSRERVNFDPEDTLSELFVLLLSKDKDWTPDRGRYITFAGVLIDRELIAMRDKARTVESPRNSSCRMKEYKTEEAAGEISSRRQRTANDIRRTAEGIHPISGGDGQSNEAMLTGVITDEPSMIMSRGEKNSELREAIIEAMRPLSAFESMVISKLSGLMGNTKQSVHKVAFDSGRDQSDIRRIRAKAHKLIRDHLNSIQHHVAMCDEG